MTDLKDGTRRQSKTISRREFLGGTLAAAATISIVPRNVLGGPGFTAPSDKLNIACIGVTGKGFSDILSIASENVVALCDVDDTKMIDFCSRAGRRSEEAKTWLDKAKRYRDFRRMLDEMGNTIDAVTVSTPDHTHAVAAVAAIRMKKHAFVQKPLTHTVAEARLLAEEAEKYGVTTQMGNQGHASEEARLINEWIWDGAIGAVREVHCWTNRPVWPQNIERPKETPPVPSSLDWDLWLGPSPERPFHPCYHPFAWRGWWDFGSGVVGDMGAHIMDHPYWALKLGAPKTVTATTTPFNGETYPVASIITCQFPERGDMPPVKLMWYDGGLMPPRPEELEPGRRMGDDNGGVIFIGDRGKLMCSCYGANPRLFPETAMQAYTRPAKTIPRSPGISAEWIGACKAGVKSTTDFSYSGPLTEAMLLGNIAIRMKEKNTVLEWDPVNMKFPNCPEADEFVRMPYRQGWEI
jgi:predicted dehydrogenase